MKNSRMLKAVTLASLMTLMLMSTAPVWADPIPDADPCTVRTEIDDLDYLTTQRVGGATIPVLITGYQSMLRYILQEFLGGRSDQACNAAFTADGLQGFENAVYFNTPEANLGDDRLAVDEINLVGPIEIDLLNTAILGNMSQSAADDTTKDTVYEADALAAYTRDAEGRIKDYGSVIIDARTLTVNPFHCTARSDDLTMRNVIFITNGITYQEFFASEDCLKDGGNVFVCSQPDEYTGAHPLEDADWCGTTATRIVYRDADGDSYGNPTNSRTISVNDPVPAGYVTNDDDCNDSNRAINPGAAEICNGIDDNCNGQIDEGLTTGGDWFFDTDSDGFGDPNNHSTACVQPQGTVTNDDDCNDSNTAINPDAQEICNDIDDDCDTLIDDADDSITGQPTWFRDGDRDTFGNPNISRLACDQPRRFVANDDDCDDSDPALTTDCTTPVDEEGGTDADANEECSDRLDNDGDTFVDCNDSGCANLPACEDVIDEEGGTDDDAAEECSDRLDNDTDTLTDCEDPGCMELPICDTPIDEEGGTDPDANEECTDTLDNDGDGFVNCDDSGCQDLPICDDVIDEEGGTDDDAEQECSDVFDNDGDGLTDCNDSGCAELPICDTPIDEEGGTDSDAEEECTDTLDNDSDGFVNCDDSGCQDLPVCDDVIDEEGGTDDDANDECSDDQDNDSDTLMDCEDPGCAATPVCSDPEGGTDSDAEEECADGLDNDSDDKIDCADDSCDTTRVCHPELPEGAGSNPVAECSDVVDNDSDGLTDCNDSGCKSLAICQTIPEGSVNPEQCTDGQDNDGDGLVDCDENECSSVLACQVTPVPGPGFGGELRGDIFGCTLSPTATAGTSGLITTLMLMAGWIGTRFISRRFIK